MSLESKRLDMELLNPQAAKAELEFKIEERLLEIERIRAHIGLQEQRIEEVTLKIQSLEEQEGGVNG